MLNCSEHLFCVGIFRFDFLSEGDEGLGVQFLSNILADSNTREFSPNERPLFPKTPFHLLSNIFRCRYDGDDTSQPALSLIIDCQSFHAPINKNHNFGSLFALFSDYIQTHLRFTFGLPNRGVHVKGYICITQN